MTTFLKNTLVLLAIVFAQIASAQTRDDGMAAMHLEDWDSAVRIYSALSKANPGDQDLLLTLGNMYLAKGDKAKAAETFKAAFEAKNDGALALVALARQKMLEHDIPETDKLLKKASKAARKDMVARRQIGETYMFYVSPNAKRPNYTRTEELLLEAVDVNSKDFETLMSLAYTYKEKPDGGKSVLYYEYAENREPKNPLPKLMIGLVYKTAKVPEKPVQYFDKAIELKPSYTPALRAKAEYLYFGRKWEKATQAYKNLVNNGDAVKIEDETQLANCLYITHDCKGCSELVNKILAKDGSKNYLRRLQAYCDYENGDFARGLKILDEYFKVVTPEKVLPSDYEYHGNFLIKTEGDTMQAIADYRKAMEMDTTGGRWMLNKEIAELLYAQRDMCGSAQAYQVLMDSVPNDDRNYATYLFYFGNAQYYCTEDSMRYAKAEMTFKKITEKLPDVMLGWQQCAKAAEAQDPSPEEIEANPEMANQYGKARAYHEKIVELGMQNLEKYKKDVLKACNYLAYCYFVKKEESNFNDITNKWLSLETDPDKVQTINDMKEAFGKDEEGMEKPKGGNKK